jgi:hypothetical protein
VTAGDPLDLVVLVPGKDERETIDGLLSARRQSLGMAEIRYELLVHPRRDAGCFHEAPAVLQPFLRRARHALVLFDFEGSGQEARTAQQVTEDLQFRLASDGWEDRVAVVVIDPELEIWLWADSPRVETELGWTGRDRPLREWLHEKGWWGMERRKPEKPKEALERTLREVRIPRSSAIYGRLARRVGLRQCQDPSFHRLLEILRTWFPAVHS